MRLVNAPQINQPFVPSNFLVNTIEPVAGVTPIAAPLVDDHMLVDLQSHAHTPNHAGHANAFSYNHEISFGHHQIANTAGGATIEELEDRYVHFN